MAASSDPSSIKRWSPTMSAFPFSFYRPLDGRSVIHPKLLKIPHGEVHSMASVLWAVEMPCGKTHPMSIRRLLLRSPIIPLQIT